MRSPVQSSQSPTALVPEKPIEREIAAGETHSYQIALSQNQYLRVLLDRKGLNPYMTLFAPDGSKLFEVNRAAYSYEMIPLLFVADTTGSHRLDVSLRAGDKGPGPYRVSVEELRAATETDSKRVLAEWTFVEGQRLFEQGKAQSLRKSIEKRQEALALYRELGNRLGEAKSLNTIGQGYSELAEHQKSLDFYSESLPIYQALEDRSGQAIALGNIGVAYSRLSDNQKAIDYYNRALALYRATGGREGEATTLSNIGVSCYLLSEFRKAADHFKDALSIHQSIGYRRGQVLALTNTGHAYAALSELQEALRYFTEALSLVRTMSIPRLEADSLTAIGGVYSSLGEHQKAMSYYTESLPLQRATGNRSGEANALARIGRIIRLSGEDQRALDHFNQSLSIFRAISDRRGETSALRDLGQLYSFKGDKQKAVEYFSQALAVARTAGNPEGEAVVLNDIGSAYASLGQYEKAHDHLNQALAIYRKISHRNGQSQALYNLARAHRSQGNLTQARSLSDEALQIVESLRGKVAGPELRASFFASVQSYYNLNIDVLMQLHQQRSSEGFDRVAFETSERARARSLLELLAEARADIRQGVDPNLIERERSLDELIVAKANRQTRMLGGRHAPEQAQAAAREVQSLLTEYQRVRAEIRARSPRYAALTQPQPASLGDIQQKVLDKDTLLLEYALGEDRSYLWAVSQDSITSHQLPGRAEIEALGRRFYELARTDSNRAEVTEAAYRLSQMLLSPAADRLGEKRLMIVADGILHYIPFSALPLPDQDVKSQKSKIKSEAPESFLPLITRHEVVSLPSASVLAEMRRDLQSRRPARRAIAVFADPVFASDDPRLKTGNKSVSTESLASDLERATRDVGLAGGFPRLPFSRREAEAIAATAPRGQSVKALDFQASRDAATSTDLSNYRIVHFATHGLLNSNHPELSGIVLSLVDSQGQPQNGFLRLSEIYNLRLPAELIVLSACQTGLGKEIRGEGVVGLTRGFMYAGAARVVASLWKVDDAATAELMKRFYRGMFARGLRPAAALREAQLEMSKEDRWRQPYFWAAFVLQGEWK